MNAIGTTASAMHAIVIDTAFQPCRFACQAITGRKISWPVVLAAVSAPITSPRLATNQRDITVAAITVAIAPDPSPTITPHVRKR